MACCRTSRYGSRSRIEWHLVASVVRGCLPVQKGGISLRRTRGGLPWRWRLPRSHPTRGHRSLSHPSLGNRPSRRGAQEDPRALPHPSLAVVFVVAADPELELVVLVAAFRRPVEDRVVAHQELDPASPCRIGVVDRPVVQDEGAEALALG